MSNRLNRRRFMLNWAALQLAIPAFANFRAMAAGENPKRAIFIGSANGTMPYAFWPGVQNNGDGRSKGIIDAQFYASKMNNGILDLNLETGLPGILEPAFDFRSKMSLIHGVDVKIGASKNEDHMWGANRVFSGMIDGGQEQTSKTIDSHLAQKLGVERISMGVQSNNKYYSQRWFYGLDNKPASILTSTDQSIARIFAGTAQPVTAGGGVQKLPSAFLDAAYDSFKGSLSHFPLEVRTRLQQNMDVISDISKKIKDQNDSSGEATQALNVCPDRNSITSHVPMNSNGYGQFDVDTFKSQLDLMFAAMACGNHKIGAFSISHPLADKSFSAIGVPNEHHIEVSHGTSGNGWENKLITINRFFVEQVVNRIVKQLDSLPEGDGTMLDNTLVYWDQDLAYGRDHTQWSHPILAFGGKNLGMPQGKMVSYNNSNRQNGMNRDDSPHTAEVMNKICDLMGVDRLTAAVGAVGKF